MAIPALAERNAYEDNNEGYSQRSLIGVWLVLVAVTVGSLVLGIERTTMSGFVPVSVTALCFVKIGLIGAYFIELRVAHRVLIALFSVWVVITCAVLMGFYW